MRFRAGLPLRAKGCATPTTEQRPSVDFSRTEELEFLLWREVLGEERRNRGNGSSPCFDAGKKVGIESEIGARASSISARKARPFVTFYRLEGSRQTRPKSIIRSLVGNSE